MSGREQDRYQIGVSMKMKENKHCTKETIRARVSERENQTGGRYRTK